MTQITYHAQEQIKRLTPSDKRELDRLLLDRNALGHSQQVASDGKRVSKLGQKYRVVWREQAGEVTVLSITYA